MKKPILFCIVISLICFSFTRAPQSTPTPIPSPSAVAAVPTPSNIPQGGWPIKGWQQAYTDFVKANVTPAMINSDPITTMCPGYMRANGPTIWAAIIQADSLAESGWDRTNRYVEPGLGNDSYTGVQVTSEGLEQLSYDDVPDYGLKHCGISWAADKNKAVTDPTKTIFDPIINLGCTIEIMDSLIQKNQGSVVMQTLSEYWSTMRIGSRMDQSCDFRVELKKLYPSCNTPTGDC